MAKYSLEYYNKQMDVDATVITQAKQLAAVAEDIKSLVEIVKSVELLGYDDGVIEVVLERILALNTSSF